jgi:hypothetical protein
MQPTPRLDAPLPLAPNAPQLVPLDQSRLKGLVNTRAEAMADIGWDPEWEVNPKELKLIQRIGGEESAGRLAIWFVNQKPGSRNCSLLRPTHCAPPPPHPKPHNPPPPPPRTPPPSTPTPPQKNQRRRVWRGLQGALARLLRGRQGAQAVGRDRAGGL